MSGTCRYFPKQQPLTEAIYKVFNDNADLMLEHFASEDSLAYHAVTTKIETVRPLGGFSLATKEQNIDASNLVDGFVAGYGELSQAEKPLFRKVIKGLSDAIAAAEKRDPGALDRMPDIHNRNMLSWLGSKPAIRDLLVNQKGIV